MARITYMNIGRKSGGCGHRHSYDDAARCLSAHINANKGHSDRDTYYQSEDDQANGIAWIVNGEHLGSVRVRTDTVTSLA